MNNNNVIRIDIENKDAVLLKMVDRENGFIFTNTLGNNTLNKKINIVLEGMECPYFSSLFMGYFYDYDNTYNINSPYD